MDVSEKIEFVRSTLGPMAWHTFPHVGSILEAEQLEGRHVGSAVRILARGRRCIVTAAHVIEQARLRTGRVAVSAVRGSPPFELHGEPDMVNSVADIAAFFVGDDYPTEGIAFWPQERIDSDDSFLSTDYLLVHGFPAAQSRFFALADGVVSRSFPYGGMRREDALPADLQPFQFAMDFDPENMESAPGRQGEWPDPTGLSGSGVWRIGASGRRVDTWSLEASRLVGIVTQWRPDEKLIVATKSHAILDLLVQGAITTK